METDGLLIGVPIASSYLPDGRFPLILHVDCHAIQSSSSKDRGIGRYTKSLLRQLSVLKSSLIPNTEVILWQNPDLDNIEEAFGFRVEKLTIKNSVGRYSFDLQMTTADPGRVLLTSPHGSYLENSLAYARHTTSAIVYDLIPLVYRDRYLIHPKQSSVYNKYLACLANLDKLFCISHTTENDVKSRLQVRGEIVYAGTAVDSVIFNRAIPLDSDYLVEFGLQSKNYVVSVASSDERKGMLRALEAHFGSYDRNTRGIGLALIGNLDPRSKANMEKIIYARKSSLLSKGIRVDAPIVLIPKVTDDKIVQLYLNALFSVFVSYYEGAGLPVLESMQMGVPVVAGDRSAIPEFAGEGDQVAYCDPTSIPSISRAMTTMIRRCIDVSPQVITQACYQQADKFDWSSICQVIIDKLDLS